MARIRHIIRRATPQDYVTFDHVSQNCTLPCKGTVLCGERLHMLMIVKRPGATAAGIRFYWCPYCDGMSGKEAAEARG